MLHDGGPAKYGCLTFIIQYILVNLTLYKKRKPVCSTKSGAASGVEGSGFRCRSELFPQTSVRGRAQKRSLTDTGLAHLNSFHFHQKRPLQSTFSTS